MISLSRKTIVLKPILGAAPGFALALVGCIVAMGVFAAVLLDDMSAAEKRTVSSDPGSVAGFEPPQNAIVRSSDSDSAQPWLSNAAAFPANDPAPRMAIVVIDDGSDAAAALNAMRLPAPVTLAIAPTADSADTRAEAARRYGREVLLLLPMQAENTFDRSQNPIAIHVPPAELRRRMNWNLAQIDGYVGVMNQHGEATTRDAGTMRAVMEIIQAKGLSFIDSRAHDDSIGSAVARRMGVPTGDRVVAVNEGSDAAELGAGLTVALNHAERWGTAIVTVPAERVAINALKDWMTSTSSTVRLAPVTAVVKRSRSGKS